MQTWKQVKAMYPDFISLKGLKQPERRYSALDNIERYLQATHPSLLKGYTLFAEIDKGDLKEKFRNWKGSINGAENQVINDFYRLAKMPQVSAH